MAVRTYPHSIRFSSDEWRAVTQAAERLDMMPGAFVREAAARAATQGFDLDESRLTPELITDRVVQDNLPGYSRACLSQAPGTRGTRQAGRLRNGGGTRQEPAGRNARTGR